MTNTPGLRVGSALLFALALVGTGCSRERVNSEVDQAKRTADTVAAKTDRAVDDAKREVKQVGAQLPSSEEIRDGVNHAGDELKAAAQQLEAKALAARKSVREHLARSK